MKWMLYWFDWMQFEFVGKEAFVPRLALNLYATHSIDHHILKLNINLHSNHINIRIQLLFH
jgi:hypothetical protein